MAPTEITSPALEITWRCVFLGGAVGWEKAQKVFFGGKAVGPRFKIHVIEKNSLGIMAHLSAISFGIHHPSFSLNPCLCGIIFISTI